MNRTLLDPRVLAPLLAASVAFSFRAQPAPRPVPSPPPRAIELPSPPVAPQPKTATSFVLDTEASTVRFLVEGGDGELLTACKRFTGSLRLDPQAEASEFELRLDLGSLSPVGNALAEVDLRRLLGVHTGSEIHYRGKLVRTSTSPVPGVIERVWLGGLQLDGRLVRQPMQTWQCSLAGQPLRLQGHGTVDVTEYGLPRRSRLGVLRDDHAVTIGLDLVWRRDNRH